MSDAPAKAQRPAARILLMDEAGRVLLFRFTATDRPPFWSTVGGALDPSEDYEAGARRELLEETGIEADCGEQVARRLVEFVTLEGIPVEADERYFLVRTRNTDIATHGHTELEKQVMREWRWFAPEEIDTWHEKIWPENLTEMLKNAANVPAPSLRAERSNPDACA